MSPSLQAEIKQQKPFASTAQEAIIQLLRTANKVRRSYDCSLYDLNLTLQQYNVLRILNGSPDPLPTMEIGERLVEPTPGITRLMQRIEKNGLALSHAGCDKRQHLWRLSAKGRKRLEKADLKVRELDSLPLSSLQADELETICSLLEKFREPYQ